MELLRVTYIFHKGFPVDPGNNLQQIVRPVLPAEYGFVSKETPKVSILQSLPYLWLNICKLFLFWECTNKGLQCILLKKR